MRKLFTLIAALMLYTGAQAQQYSCSELMEYVEDSGNHVWTDGVIGSDAIDWAWTYEIDGNYYVIIEFKSSTQKYLYGGISYSDAYDFYFANGSEKGEAFWKYIQHNKLNCY